MKNILIFISLFFSSLGFTQKNDTIKALFLGNSYTGVNNLPNLVFEIANSMNDTLIWKKYTPGGKQLIQHAVDPTTQTFIKEGIWDRIVLQEQSQKPSFPDNQVNSEVYPYAKQLNDSIKKYNPCSETVFYMTWGRKNGDASNCPGWPPVCTYEGMDDLLRERYETMAADNDAEVSPVGAVWRSLRTNHPEIELYSADESHPSLAGSYAAACTFYTVFYKKNPTLITFNSSLSVNDANNIKATVENVVYNELANWNIGKYVPTPLFSFSVKGNGLTKFNNNSKYSESYFWEFGDGNNSNEMSPNHQYLNANLYTTRLTVYDKTCNIESFIEKDVDISILYITDNLNSTPQIYPIPTKRFVKISSNKSFQTYKLYSIDGKLTLSGNITNSLIDLEGAKKGTYMLIISSGKLVRKKEIIIK